MTTHEQPRTLSTRGSVLVKLEWFELEAALAVSMRRSGNALRIGAKHKYDYKGLALENMAMGCISELAVAKYLGVFYTGSVGQFKSAPDVFVVDVRATSKPQMPLIIRDDDPDGRPVVHCIVHEQHEVELVGWILAQDGKQSVYRTSFGNGRAECYGVPHEHLHDMHTLKRRVIATLRKRFEDELAALEGVPA